VKRTPTLTTNTPTPLFTIMADETSLYELFISDFFSVNPVSYE
jgi:hypothetical protein